MQEGEGSLIFLCEAPGEGCDRGRLGTEIAGADYIFEIPWVVWDRPGIRANSQDRAASVPEQDLRVATEEKTLDAGVDVGAEDDQVGTLLLGAAWNLILKQPTE